MPELKAFMLVPYTFMSVHVVCVCSPPNELPKRKRIPLKERSKQQCTIEQHGTGNTLDSLLLAVRTIEECSSPISPVLVVLSAGCWVLPWCILQPGME